MSKLFSNHVLAAIVLTFPMAALADNTVTLASGSGVNLATNATGSSGGDILWNGTTLTFQRSATGVDLASTPIGTEFNGQMGYSQLVQEATSLPFAEFGAEFGMYLTTTPITPAVNDILVVSPNSGGYSAVLVNSISGGSITLEYTTFGGSSSGGGTTSGGPTITGIENNYSYIPAGFPNSGIAPGSLFVLYGSAMSSSPTGNLTLNSSASPGIPTTWEGATLTVTVGGTTVTPGMYYATPTQIAAVLPSKTPTGAATITVSYNGATSNAFSFQVVPSALGLDTYYGTGSGLVTATNTTNGALYNYTNSAKPGETIVLWGSGLGADTADSDTVFTSTPHAVNTPLKIYFGGIAGTVLYAGSSGYPGVNQIDVTIPENVPLSCTVSLVAVTGSGSSLTASNFGSLALSASGGECNNSEFGISGTTISNLSGQSTVRYGDVFVAQLVQPATPPQTGIVTNNFAFADFEKESGSSFSTSSGSIYSVGSCYVSQVVNISGTIPTFVGLDAGSISLTGPAGTYSLMSFEKGEYTASLPSNAISSSGGAFSYNGSGGVDVGSFKTTINLPNPILDWTNQSADATVNRVQGVTANWTGGGPGTYVIITGNSSNASSGAYGSFTCLTNQSDLTFTVPNYVTLTLPAGTGTLSVENLANYTAFTASGLDYGTAFGFTGTEINVTYQ